MPTRVRRGFTPQAVAATGLARCGCAALALCALAACERPPTGGPSARTHAPNASAPAATASTDRPHHPSTTMPSPSADTLAQLDAALRGDAPSAVLAAARATASADGRAMARWAQARWQDGDVDALARVLVRLALGNDLQQDAVQHFSGGPLAEDGSPSYAHAVALGYFIGALQAGLQAAADREAARQDLVTALLRSAARQAGVAEPDAALPSADASAAAKWVRYNLYPLLHPGTATGADAATRLQAAAVPVTAVRVRANGEPDLEIAVGSQARSAFTRRLQAARQALPA